MQKKNTKKASSSIPTKRKKQALGRGLGALIPDIEESQEDSKDLFYCEIELIRPNRFQPRMQFDEDELAELCQSIKEQGILQPLLVREENDGYELIAGERRWRAAQQAGLDEIPVVIKEVTEEAAMAMGLIENIQRDDLNAIEEAAALHRLLNEFELTHQEVAQAVGKSRTTVTNLLRLLELNPDVKQLIDEGRLEMGHARALLALKGDPQSAAAAKVAARGLSVRETELLVKKTLAAQSEKSKPKTPAVDPDVRRLENQLSEKLGAAVKIKAGKKGSGQLVIHFHSSAELEGILEHLAP